MVRKEYFSSNVFSNPFIEKKGIGVGTFQFCHVCLKQPRIPLAMVCKRYWSNGGKTARAKGKKRTIIAEAGICKKCKSRVWDLSAGMDVCRHTISLTSVL